MKPKIFTFLALFLIAGAPCLAQTDRIPSTSSNLSPTTSADRMVVFSVSAEGKRFQPIWGLDQAWISEQNFRKGINHMGKENIGIGRSTFRVKNPLVDDSKLDADATNYLTRRNRVFNILSDTLPLVLTCDQEAGVAAYYRTGNSANVDRWSKMLNAHVEWLNNNTKHRVAGISPFNEPDYWTEEGATINNSRDIAKKLKTEYPLFSNIAIVGGNTLNDDKAASWYTPGKDYYDWGNTHQLAGSMNNYKAFYQLLARDGKVGYNDEMHNVAEAFIGLEYGMTVGIWWGYDSRARGEFCDISRHGVRIGYAEHPNNWTAATVYRHDDGRVKAFLGSSERQAYTTSYQFLSTDHEVYYDGVGPTREIKLTIHGGTGYQQGQKNAERVIDVTWGADVQPSAIGGTYKIMNKASKMMLSEHGESGGNPNISQTSYTGSPKQQWIVQQAGNSVDGDYSFYIIKSVNDGKFMDVLNFSTSSGANVISYGTGTPSTNQVWYLEYAGDGYYYIRNRESALYLTLSSNSQIQGININQQTKLDDPSRQLWRFLPLDAEVETDAPAAPTNLTATAQSASVLLEWDANQEADVDGYMVIRTEKGKDNWNTIARKVKTAKFIDNSCRQGTEYTYAVKAIDYSENQSAVSESVNAAPTGEPAMTANWLMYDDVLDATANQFDGAVNGNPSFVASNYANIEGKKSLYLNAANQFVQLPYEIASTEAMTFAAWVNWRSSSAANQRLFDFGNGSTQYMYLTPSNGTKISFVINDGKESQTLTTASRLSSLLWKHVALTISRDSTVIYVDGVKAGHSTDITIMPSDIHPVLNYLGRSQDGSAPQLKAYLNDVRIYNYALTAEEVKEMMEDSTDGIRHMNGEPSPTTPSYYTLSGIKIAQPLSKGTYIKKEGDKVQTILVR